MLTRLSIKLSDTPRGLDDGSSDLLKRHNSTPKVDTTNKLADQTVN